jgi:hypothetical protein
MGKFVYDNKLGLARQRGVDVEFLNETATIITLAPGHGFQALGKGLRFAPPMGFGEADHHVEAIGLCGPRSREHGICLANARRRAEENSEFAAPITFSDSKQRVRIRTAVEGSLLRWHKRQTLLR